MTYRLVTRTHQYMIPLGMYVNYSTDLHRAGGAARMTWAWTGWVRERDMRQCNSISGTERGPSWSPASHVCTPVMVGMGSSEMDVSNIKGYPHCGSEVAAAPLVAVPVLPTLVHGCMLPTAYIGITLNSIRCFDLLSYCQHYRFLRTCWVRQYLTHYIQPLHCPLTWR
jgi:hypothetical protein